MRLIRATQQDFDDIIAFYDDVTTHTPDMALYAENTGWTDFYFFELKQLFSMDKMIACCGINCETCEARIATIKNDDKMRVEVAKKWCEMNHTDQITPESINCVGCRVEGPKFYFCSHMCEVKKCVAAKGYETCGDCPDKNLCKKVGAIWENSAEAKENLCGK